MVETLKHIDTNLLLAINQAHSPFLDKIMWFASGNYTWLPLYIILFIVLILKFKKQSIPLILLISILILLSDQFASGLIKPLVQRLRPSHEPSLQNLLHYVNDYHGGKYGFISSHACNAFALSFYFMFSLKTNFKWITYLLFLWAFFVSYSRIYLGVHYPSDVIVPIFVALPIAFGVSRLNQYLTYKYFPTP
jgi:undecaprenyl-diphosphatase